MKGHSIAYADYPSKETPIEVQCECGARIPARSDKDALEMARVHTTAERLKLEQSQSHSDCGGTEMKSQAQSTNGT